MRATIPMTEALQALVSMIAKGCIVAKFILVYVNITQ